MMDTYIIRIYQRDVDNKCILAGTLEEPGSGCKVVFNSMNELELYLLEHFQLSKPNDKQSE